jgi:hypothetical protein
MSNYTKISKIFKDLEDRLKVKLTFKQREFIYKVHSRNLRAFRFKNKLFDFWDNLPYKVDGKVFKSLKHFESFKVSAFKCGSFTDFKAPKDTDLIKLVNAGFCRKDKICPTCAVGRAFNMQKKFFQSLEVFPYHYDDDLLSKYWYYIVTPVKHSIDEPLEVVYQRVSNLRKSALKQMRNSRHRNTAGFWSNFKGGMGSIELTFSNNGWNVHINWLVYSDNRISYKEVTDGKKTWFQNDDLEKFLNRFNGSYIHSVNELDFSSKETIRKNLLEVLKYSLKFSSLSFDKLIEAYYKLYRKRLFFTFGALRGLDLEAVDDVTIGDDIEEYNEFYEAIFARVYDSEIDNYFYDLISFRDLKKVKSN